MIKEKDLVIVQKGNYFKACRVTSKRSQKFGKYGEGQIIINLENGIGHPFGSTFRLVRANKRIFNLELNDENAEGLDLDFGSGNDNRNIFDDGQNQSLSKTDIQQLVDSGISGDEVIQTLAHNSKTFKSKTKYSQEKYVSKKLKKYDELVTLHRPSIRLLVHMYYSQDPLKISNLRVDSLSQMMAYANVQSGGRYAVYEAGMQGLVSAAMLSHIGSSGSLVHIYSGSYPHREAVELMGFTNEDLLTLSYISADILPTTTTSVEMEPAVEEIASVDNASISAREETTSVDNAISSSVEETASVDTVTTSTINEANGFAATVGDDKELGMVEPGEKTEGTDFVTNRKFVRTRNEDIQISTKILREGVNGLVVACRQHPAGITMALLSYLRPGHSFAIFSPYKETLMDLFTEMKSENCINIRLVENWLRNYQVLPQRTHPEINMSGGGGYILTGWKVGK